ncbi:Ig-like domain-containing protein [Candidatus Palauibacter sp.]|uniref:Ig-like domain-containing protein n=1 Tax=Candidatus Palauibacter sp. TaxID=3101350 RepID=UPI003B516537
MATTVEVAPATAELTALGQTVQLTATVRDQNGGVMSGASVSWTSGDAAVASVDAAGLITAVATGTAAISATSGSASGTASVTVTQAPAQVAVTPESATLSAVGDTVRFAAEVQDANGNAIAGTAVSWTSSDDAIAMVDETGLVTAVSPGMATIEATSGTASGSGTVAVMQEAATLTVTPDRLRLTAVGERGQLTAEALDANGNALADPMLNWTSDDDAVATVDAAGLVTAVANGETAVTVTSGSTRARVRVAVEAGAAPAAGPPTPPHAADSVIALFSDAYDDVTVDTWSADWDAADLTDIEIAGDPARLYTNLSFAGIEFASQPVDATDMDYFRMDLWTPDDTGPAAFRVKLVDFGQDGAFGGGDDSEHEVTITASEGLASEEWVQLDLWLDDFANLAARANLAQLIISGDPNTVYVDNVYFRQGSAPPPDPEPTDPAPTPEDAADEVLSLFSDAYDDVMVDTWSASWDQAAVEDVEVSGDAVKKYTGLAFAGIEFTSATLDASDMTHFRMDIWTPDDTAAPAAFRVKLVDFGADGVWSPAVDDTEHELTITAAEGLASEEWVQLDLSLADFTNLTSRANLAQLIISGDPNTVYVDNVYFRSGKAPPAPTAPSAPSPAPSHAADNVISFFSDAYTDVTVDTWSASWDQADLEDVEVSGDAVKKYTNLTFAGIEFTSQTVDATDMTHFRLDIWTPDSTDQPAAFRIKLVDFGADGAFGGGDDSEHEVSLTAASEPTALATSQWVSFDIPLSDFASLAARGHLAQLIVSGDPNTVFIDNVYLRK